MADWAPDDGKALRYQRTGVDQVGELNDCRRRSWSLSRRWNDALDQRYMLGVPEELIPRGNLSVEQSDQMVREAVEASARSGSPSG